MQPSLDALAAIWVKCPQLEALSLEGAAHAGNEVKTLRSWLSRRPASLTSLDLILTAADDIADRGRDTGRRTVWRDALADARAGLLHPLR